MLLQIKELLERHLDANEISHRLHVDLAVVQEAIRVLSDLC